MFSSRARHSSKSRTMVAVATIAFAISGCAPANKIKAAVTGGSSSTSPASSRSLAFVDAPSVDLGTVAAGSSTFVRLSLSSGGSGDATIVSSANSDSAFTFNGGSFPGTGGTCGTTIRGNCSIALLFTVPASTVGLFTDTVTIRYLSGTVTTSISITLSAYATLDASVTINGGVTAAFGTKNVATTTDLTLTVANVGGLTATQLAFTGLSAPITYAGGTYPGTGGTCGTSLLSSASCTLVLRYAPTVAGATSRTLALAYSNGTAARSTSIGVTGTAITLASVAITAPATNPYDYGTIVIGATAPSVTVTLANTGGQAATSLAVSGLSAPITYAGGTFPGTAGTCGATLAAGASCTIVITFTPTIAGLATKTLDVAFDDGSATTTHLTHGLQGTGQTPASLSISDGGTYDFGSHITGTTTNFTFTVTNSGGTSATAMSGTALAAGYAYRGGGAYPGTTGSCGATLAGGATCTIAVSFVPATAGVLADTLTLGYNNGIGAVSATRPMTGTGTLSPASISITTPIANPYDYGTVYIGAPGPDLTITLSNSGGQSATSLLTNGLTGPFNYKDGIYPGTGGNCGVTLAAAATCDIVVTFLPTTAGYVTRTLAIAYHDGSSTVTLSRPLEGTGQAPALLGISDGPTYDFGSYATGTTTNHTFTITNSGGVTATGMAGAALTAPYRYKGGGAYPGTGGTCGATLAAAATCTVILSFVPTVAGASSDTLSIAYGNGYAATTATLPLTGAATLPLASLAMTTPAADPYDYGTATIGAAAVDLTLTLSNGGGQAATSLAVSGVTAPFSFKDTGVYPGNGGTCGATLAAAATCTFVITFLPTTPGLDTNTLDISYNDGSGTIHLSRVIRGTGANPALLTISDGATYDFGSRTVGTTTHFTFTVTNSGGSTATAMSGGALTSPFLYKGGGAYPGASGSCGATLGAGATCTITTSFSPSATGAFTDSLTLAYSNGVSATSSSRPLAGTGGAVGNLSISDGATFAFGSVVKGYTLSKTFTITNIGGAAVSAISGAALAAPYHYLDGTFPGTGGTCGATLGVGGTCTVVIQFAPTSAATSNATFTLDYNDSTTATSSARAITGSGSTISKVAGGASHTCALYSTGIVKCWGSNFYGQLGNASNVDSTSPVSVNGISTATDLAAGANHTCALLANSRIYCWGADATGQLGDNATLASVNSPVQVGAYTDFTRVAAGGDLTCGLRAGGTIACWGDDSEGGNGNGAGFGSNATPVTVNGLTGMIDVAVGRSHACGTKSDNTFRCWGSDSAGQLGTGGGGNSDTPVTPAPGTALSAWAGGDNSCAMLSGGSVACWGADDYGQVGDGAPLASLASPTTVAGLANVTKITFGLKHGCALDASNATLCWGRDTAGQLGDDGSYADQVSPVAVTGMTSVNAIGAGENHSCAVRSTGLVYCWGANDSGQLGDGTAPTNHATPVLVQGL